MRRAASVCAIALAVAILPAGPSAAHEGNPDFRSEVQPLTPATDGVEVRVLNYDDSLELENRSGQTVTVDGYQGEPYLRILGDGTVQVNVNSPAYYLNRDRFGEVDVPGEVDSAAPPEWMTVDSSGRYAWHDHRSHYMGRDTPEQVTDESEETKVFDYSIPIEIGGQPGAIAGTLTWVGRDSGFPVLPFVILAVVAAGVAALVIIRRRRDRGDEGGQEAW